MGLVDAERALYWIKVAIEESADRHTHHCNNRRNRIEMDADLTARQNCITA